MSTRKLTPLEMLQSADLETVLNGVELIEEKGKTTQLPELFRCYLTHTELPHKKALYELLSSITIKGAKEAWIALLSMPEFTQVNAQIVNILWNTRLDFSAELERFVQLAVQLDYLGTLECLTLIENMEGPFQEHQLLESELILKEYVKKQVDEGAQKQQLIFTLVQHLEQLKMQEDHDLFFE
jgi:hypothetical protein